MASGTDLKVERIRAGLTQKQVASRMGTTRQTLYVLERMESVPETRAAEYRAALSATAANEQAVA